MFRDEVIAICSRCGDLLSYASEMCVTDIETEPCETCGATDWDIEFELE